MMSGRDRDAGASVRVDSIDQLLRGASICESSASGGRAADLRAATTFAGSLSTTADSCIALIILDVKEWRQLGPAAEQAALAGAIRAPKVRLCHLGQDLFHTVGWPFYDILHILYSFWGPFLKNNTRIFRNIGGV